MRRTALVTGASSGIGRELARICARESMNLVLVARDQRALNKVAKELKSDYNITVAAMSYDLSDPRQVDSLIKVIKDKRLGIDVLINNAGIGDYGLFKDSDLTKQRAIIELNINAVTALTHAFLPNMIERGSGRILNLASIASFIPGPYMSVYNATKSYVLSYSEALAQEISSTGVTVTALCPGPTKSHFSESASIDPSSKLFSGKLPTAQSVAEYGFEAMMNGQRVAIPGLKNKLIVKLAKHLPSILFIKILARKSKPSH